MPRDGPRRSHQLKVSLGNWIAAAGLVFALVGSIVGSAYHLGSNMSALDGRIESFHATMESIRYRLERIERWIDRQ